MKRASGYDGASIKRMEPSPISKTYRPYDPGQRLLLSAALQEWPPADHPAYFISDIVDQLDPRFRWGRLCPVSLPATSKRGVAGRPIIPE